MRHTKKKLITLSIYSLFMTALYGGYIGSLSWFDNKSTLPDDFIGESARAFFGGGDGTSSKPYEINNARHFYNLCWLQYLGRFNRDTDNDGVINQVYFKLTADIDCSKLDSALPPIGTTRYPFVGNFDGDDKIISNYTITDEYSELKKHPSIIDTEETYYTSGNKTINYCSIIGTFGVIGYNTTGAIDVQSSETSLYGFTTDQLKVNAVNNLYIDNVSIKPATTNTLAGLLAGYVSANMSGCGVHYSNLDFSNGNTNINSKFNNKLSNYTLIGDYNSDEYKWSDVQSSGTNIGGSLDIFSLSKRITYMSKNLTMNNKRILTESEKWHLSMGLSSTGSTYYDYTDTSTLNSAMLIYNTYLPLNVKSSDIIEEFYNSEIKKEESIETNKNTGYVVGGGNEDQQGYGNAEVRLRNQACKKDASGLDNSFNDKTNVTTTTIKDNIISDSNIDLWYYNTINNQSSKIDSTIKQNFIKKDETFVYDVVKQNLITMLKDATSTGNYYAICPGFFIRKQSSTIDLEKHILQGSNVHIYDKNYSSYDFYTGGINFSLNTDGYLTMVLANYANATTGFFDIYKVDRTNTSATSILTGYHKIKKISKTNDSYGYLYSDNSQLDFDSSNVVFSFENNTSSINARSLYYFEIPLKSGDYFYTVPQGINNNPYTIYINIGASSDSSTSEKGEISNIDFFYYDNDTKQLVKITSNNKSKVIFDISGDGSAAFYFNRIYSIGVLYYDENVSGLTRTQPSTYIGTSVQASDKSCTSAK